MNITKLPIQDKPNVAINYRNVCYVERANSGTRYYFVGNSNPVFVEIPFEEAIEELNEVRW